MLSFRLFGIPVQVQPFFLLLAVFLGVGLVEEQGQELLEGMGAWVAIVFTGVLAHEFGHAFAGKLFGLSPRILLHGWGGLTSWDTGGKDLTPGKSIFVSLAGPGVGIAIGVVALGVWAVLSPADLSFVRFVLWSIVWVNLGWGVLNLLPMMPLDGGNVMSGVFELFAGRRGVNWARWLSLAVAVGLIILMVAMQNIIMAVLIAFLAMSNWRAIKTERDVGPDRALLGRLQTAQRRLNARDARGAETDAQAVLTEAKTPLVRSSALNVLVLARINQGDPAGARAFMEQMPKSHPPDLRLEAAVLRADGDDDAAFELLASRLGEQQGPAVEQGFVQAARDTERFDEAAAAVDTPRGRSFDLSILEELEEAAYRRGAHEAAARVGTVLWDIDRRPTRAYNVACALSRAGAADDAMAWLGKARKAGFDKVELLDGDRDLAVLRARGDWQALREQFGA